MGDGRSRRADQEGRRASQEEVRTSGKVGGSPPGGWGGAFSCRVGGWRLTKLQQ